MVLDDTAFNVGGNTVITAGSGQDIIASNLLIAATYAFLGQTASERGWLPAALCLSIALPILVTYAAKRRFRN